MSGREAGPWLGPRAYSEADWDIYPGRSAELDQLLRMLGHFRLGILSGASGTGKTSLLRAGLVPQLWLGRYGTGADRSSTPRPVAVLLRDWSLLNHQDPDSLLRDQLQIALQSLSGWIGREARAGRLGESGPARAERDVNEMRSLLSEQPRIPIEEILLRVASQPDGQPGLVVIIDQCEELFRRSRNSRTVYEVKLRMLLDADARLSVLLATRVEYESELRSIEAMVSPLDRRAMTLEHPTRDECAQIIARGWQNQCPVNFPELVLDRLAALPSSGSDTEVPAAGVSSRGGGAPTLLVLNAALFEIERERRRDGAASMTDWSGALDRAINPTSARAADPPPGGERCTVDSLLVRWVRESFDRSTLQRTSLDADPSGLRPTGEQSLALLRRLAVRIAPLLSSGGFKTPQESESLFRRVIKDEWLSEPANWAVSLRAAGPPEAVTEVTRACLRRYFDVSLKLLEGRGLVRESKDFPRDRQPIVMWELVHDQLGPPLIEWAEPELDSWSDSIAAITALCGTTPIRAAQLPSDGPLRYEHLAWRGCLVAVDETPREPPRRALFRGVTFSNCDFSGTVFRECDFEDVTFLGCTLDGTIFIRCRFGGPEGVRFEPGSGSTRCTINAMGFLEGCLCERLQFHSCTLNQPTFKGVSITGRAPPADGEAAIHFGDRTVVELARFSNIGGLPATRIVGAEGASVNACIADETALERMDERLRSRMSVSARINGAR